MTQNLTLVTQKPFGSLTCNVYQDASNKNEFYMTREQIGTALNYENPQKAIDNIHARNLDRLGPLSVTLKLRATDGKYYDTRVYTLRGVMEICRFSRQPNADQFMDFVWDVMESLYYGRSLLATPDQTSAIAKAAAIYHDTSCNFSVTYRSVYKNMNTDWNEAHIQFRNRYHRTAQQLKTLVMYSGVLFDRFNTAVTAYINAASKPDLESAPAKEA